MLLKDFFVLSKKHLDRNGMTYWQHFAFASGHGLRCLRAATYLIVHAAAPALFPHAGSRLVARLEKDFTEHRRQPKEGTQ